MGGEPQPRAHVYTMACFTRRILHRDLRLVRRILVGFAGQRAASSLCTRREPSCSWGSRKTADYRHGVHHSVQQYFGHSGGEFHRQLQRQQTRTTPMDAFRELQPSFLDLRGFAKNMTEPSLFNEFVHRERLVIVRNPYTRFLSSFLDWMFRNHQPNVSFEEFVMRYEHNDMKGYVYLPSHVRPAAQVCQIHLYAMTGFLRVEQMDLWFNAFIKRFGLDRFVDALSAKDKLFYKAKLTNGTRVADAMLEVFGKIPWRGTSAKTGHVRDAGAHLTEYYTPQLAQKVFDLQRDDFEHFGYPAWDGDPSTFRFV